MTTVKDLAIPHGEQGDDESISHTTIEHPTACYVPVISHLPSLSSHRSDIATSSEHETPDHGAEKLSHEPLNWPNADLNYLVTILYPELVMKDQLLCTPAIETLEECRAPYHLKLFAVLPSQPVPSNGYGPCAPVNTQGPRSTLTYLLAESEENCASPYQARRSLASSLLSDTATINKIYIENTVLSVLFSQSQQTLCSLKRGMEGMKRVGDREWVARGWQLSTVDEHCEFEPRFEMFLLDAGREELDSWMAAVDAGSRLSREERENWARAYGDTNNFLLRACLG